MTDPKHLQIRELFERALELPAERRDAFLETRCAGQPQLKVRVEALLAAVEDERFLAAPAGPSLVAQPGALVDGARAGRAAEDVTPLREAPGTRIGPYKLLQQIGEGGFGVVFLAEQEHPVRRKVALKIIKLGMDTRQVVARFEQERQALALMDHPHIARVIDAGATETGRPYFVMELVQGDPIVQYCDAKNLTIEARLDLMAQVCAAVQHAHQKGIIHRDLKPSNILVGTQDGRPNAKVIDFGIAKATSHKLTDKTLFTEHKQVIGTLQYMSPEQAEGSLDIDTRTDVYSLGVLLYELLTGSTPFDNKTMQDALYSEMQRIIREVDPPRPSTRLSESHGRIASIAAQRGIEPRRLGLLVRGDLDWIVMKALEKDRSRRYESAVDLATDLRRHLAGEAVLAAPPSASYRFVKFVRRHRGRVVAAGLVLTALVLAVVGTTTGMLRALEQKERADLASTQARLAAESEAAARIEAQHSAEKAVAAAVRADAAKTEEAQARARAETAQAEESKARARAEAVRDFVVAALGASDVRTPGGGKDATIFAAMQDAIADLDSNRFEDDPETEATLRQTIAVIMLGNGRSQAALDSAEKALKLRRRLHSGDHRDVATSLNQVALGLQALDREAEAEPLMRQSLDMHRRLASGDDKFVATLSANLANVVKSLGRPAEAEPLMEDALAMFRRLAPGDDEMVAQCLTNLGNVRSALGKNAEAEALFEEALEMSRKVYAHDHPSLATCLGNLANHRARMGRIADAEPLLSEALAIRRRLYQGDHPELAKCITNLAFVLAQLDRDDEAEALIAEGLAMDERLHAGDSPTTAHALFTLSSLRLSRPAEAEPVCEQAVAMHRRLFGSEHLGLAISLLNLARAKHALHKDQQARASFDEAVAILRRLPGGNVPLCDALWRSGRARLEREDAARALPELEEAVSLAEKELRSGSPRIEQYRATLTQCKAALGSKSTK